MVIARILAFGPSYFWARWLSYEPHNLHELQVALKSKKKFFIFMPVHLIAIYQMVRTI